MRGSLVNLNQAGAKYPSKAVLDTNLLVIHFLLVHDPQQQSRVQKVSPIFHGVSTGSITGYVTSHSLRELMHKLIRMKFEQELRTNRSAHESLLQKRWPNRKKYDWTHLFKVRSSLLRTYAADLDRLCQLMTASGQHAYRHVYI